MQQQQQQQHHQQQQQQHQQQQQCFPMVPVMQPNMQGMMGINFVGQMPAGAMPMQVSLVVILC